MKVKDVMRQRAAFCSPDMTLATATELLLKNGCGCLPVVGEGGNVIGMITDRDMCVALGTRGERPTQILVWEAMQHKLFTCSPEDTIHCALKTMRSGKVRRLPVIDRRGVLQGILSIDDIAQRAQLHTGSEGICFEDVVRTCQTISTRTSPGLTRKAAAA
jgi:CBS domain-containing protein